MWISLEGDAISHAHTLAYAAQILRMWPRRVPLSCSTDRRGGSGGFSTSLFSLLSGACVVLERGLKASGRVPADCDDGELGLLVPSVEETCRKISIRELDLCHVFRGCHLQEHKHEVIYTTSSIRWYLLPAVLGPVTSSPLLPSCPSERWRDSRRAVPARLPLLTAPWSVDQGFPVGCPSEFVCLVVRAASVHLSTSRSYPLDRSPPLLSHILVSSPLLPWRRRPFAPARSTSVKKSLKRPVRLAGRRPPSTRMARTSTPTSPSTLPTRPGT